MSRSFWCTGGALDAPGVVPLVIWSSWVSGAAGRVVHSWGAALGVGERQEGRERGSWTRHPVVPRGCPRMV
jgi:hypothetical protein